jgi:protein-tyrosine phosphatase
MSLIDLHLHLLPGVDDGPADEAASLTHARRLAAVGVREAAVTPHVGHPSFPLDVATIPTRTAALQAVLDGEGIALRLHAGGEIHPTAAPSLAADELDLIAHGPRGARWVLLEVPFAGIDARFLAGCANVRSHGFGIVVAHPERAAGLLDAGLDALWPELVRGAVLQVSVCSLLGHHGEEARAAGEHLVRTGLAYIVASDGHGGRRSHTLGAGPDLARRAGASAVRARQLTEANPAFLLRAGLPAGAPRSVSGARRPAAAARS